MTSATSMNLHYPSEITGWSIRVYFSSLKERNSTVSIKFLRNCPTLLHTRLKCVCPQCGVTPPAHYVSLLPASLRWKNWDHHTFIREKEKLLERSPVPLFLLSFRGHFMKSVTKVWDDLWPFSYTLDGWVGDIRPICIHSAWLEFNTFAARAGFQLVNTRACCIRDSL